MFQRKSCRTSSARARATGAAPVLIALGLAACSGEAGTAVPVELVESESGFRLLRGGEPYEIRGAGVARDEIESAAAHGANSIRTWTTDEPEMSAGDLLDTAHRLGLTVALGLPMAPERSGFDYDDTEAVRRQFESLREEVIRYRDHPALLFWLIGNELNLNYENPKVFDAMGAVARMIADLDPAHPTTTALSGFKPDVIEEVRKRAPDLDFLSFQLYGGLYRLPERIEATGFDRPFMVTEWGTRGHWETHKTVWGAAVEPNSSEKAAIYYRGHHEILQAFDKQLIGSYVFLWGQKQERTPTWYGVFTEDGHETEAVDVMHYIWRGSWPSNRSPRVRAMTLDGRNARDDVVLTAGETYAATFDVEDPDDDAVTYRWEVKPESDATQEGGDFEEPITSIRGLIDDPRAARIRLTAPDVGAYRLLAYAYDGTGHAAHANIPFLVRSGAE